MQALNNQSMVTQHLEVRAAKRKEWDTQFENNLGGIITELATNIFAKFSSDIRERLANPYMSEISQKNGYHQANYLDFTLSHHYAKELCNLAGRAASLAPLKEWLEIFSVERKRDFEPNIYRETADASYFDEKLNVIGGRVAEEVRREIAKDKSLEDLEIKVTWNNQSLKGKASLLSSSSSFVAKNVLRIEACLKNSLHSSEDINPKNNKNRSYQWINGLTVGFAVAALVVSVGVYFFRKAFDFNLSKI